MKQFILGSLLVVLSACGPVRTATVYTPVIDINLAMQSPQPNRFVGLEYGIRVNVQDGRSIADVLKKHDNYLITPPKTTVYPEVISFVSESTRRYMRTLGFNLDADISTDYMMNLNVKEFNLSYLSGIGWSANVQFNIEVFDNHRKLVYPNVTVVGRANVAGSGSDDISASSAINAAYDNAMKDVDWDRIAFFLDRASSAELEGNKQVKGDGNTALEATVIRWYIDSAPKGADVSFRIVSSTPDVKNTNSNYVGSTPYETTETFDVKGLTYNNSGNVQIEVVCEKAGYITQKKRFNLRQVIDQKEISTKFNLIKE